jgi:colanic acid biosynthesis glycosyl transferase WcaI
MRVRWPTNWPICTPAWRPVAVVRDVRILVLCPHFHPDVAPTGEVMTRLVTELADRGHRLEVVTSLPWYREHRIEPGWKGRAVRTESTRWGRLVRVYPFPGGDRSSLIARARSFVGFTALAGLRTVVARGRFDVVFAMSPPLTLGLPAWVAARLRRIPFVFNVQDVFPDVAVEVGALTSPRAIAVFAALERHVYRASDAVTVLSEDLRRNLAGKISARPGRGGSTDKIRVIPNFVDTEAIGVLARDNSYRAEYGLGDRTVVMYAGNVGFSQSLDLLVEAARRMVDRDDVVFVVNGGGSAMDELAQQAGVLPNMVLAPLQPRERLPEVLAAADVHTVLLKAGLAKASVPSKTYSVLAAGRPVVASVDGGTEVTRMLAESGGGVSVAPDNPDGFVEALTRLIDDPDRRGEMGRAGREWVARAASPAAVAAAYEALFEELAGGRRGGQA